MEALITNNVSDEEYVIHKAKSAFKSDPLSAKAWMITAKTLYPDNFGVQFEAYHIEKSAGHLKEAAKCFSELIEKFQRQQEFWKEIDMLTAALRSDADLTEDPDKTFLCEMFKHIPADIQHKLLLITADHCDDTMEHCKLLLLLLQKFPSSIYSHGPKLVDTLLSAEKHCPASNIPTNSYRKLLVCDLLPLLASEKVTCDLLPKLLYKLLHKAIEYYLYTFNAKSVNVAEKSEQPWIKLFGILDFVGRQLGWEPYLTNVSINWTKEAYWQKLMSFCQSPSMLDMDPNNSKQLLYCLTIFFINCLYDYSQSLSSLATSGQVQHSYVLVEAFTDINYPNPNEMKIKRRKGDVDSSLPHISVENVDNKNLKNLFVMAVNCWDFLTATEHLQREFGKLSLHLKLDQWLLPFLVDYSIYKGRYEDALSRLMQITEANMQVTKNLKIACVYFLKKSYNQCFDHILQIVPTHPAGNGNLLPSLVIGGTQRHVAFIPITESTILQYSVKMLIRAMQDNMKIQPSYNELTIGNLLVLVQLDWPQEEDTVPPLMKQIQLRGSFQYYLFQSYIINVDILEELTYLWTTHGGQITLDIVPHLGQRRIGTRGSDKGVKEEIKQAIKRQIARCNEPLDQLIATFINQERGHIHQSLR